MDTLVVSVAAGIGAAFCVGVGVALWGRRGTKINDHPCCRRCDYDLHGLVPTPRQCPECGHALKDHGTRVGQRRKRPLAMLTGFALVVLSVGLGAWGLSGRASMSMLPLPALRLIPALTSLPSRTDAVATELLDRFRAARASKSPSEEAINAIALAVADARDRPSMVWSRPWEDLLGAVLSESRVSGEVLDRVLRTYTTTTIAVRPRLKSGVQLPYRFVTNINRGGNSQVDIAYRAISASVAGEIPPKVIYENDSGASFVAYSPTMMMSEGSFGVVPPGKHSIHVAMRVDISAAGRTVSVDLVKDVEIEVMNLGVATVQAITDPAKSPASVIRKLTLQPNPYQPGEMMVNTVVETGVLPTAIGADIFVRRRQPDGSVADHKTVWVMRNAGSSGEHRAAYSTTVSLPLKRRETLVLRPNPELVEATVDQFEYWGSDIVLEDVPLDWDMAVRRGQSAPPE